MKAGGNLLPVLTVAYGWLPIWVKKPRRSHGGSGKSGLPNLPLYSPGN